MVDPLSITPAASHGGDTFTLRPRSGGGIAAVAAALARRLARLATRPERWAVLVHRADDRSNQFTQTLVDRHDGAWVEAVSNTYLEPEHHMDDDQHRLLALFGFDPPDVDHPNHWLILEPPVDWTRVAWLLVGTLEDVYGITPDDDLTLSIVDVGRPGDRLDGEDGARA